MTKAGNLINQRDTAREVWKESGYDYSVLNINNLLELAYRIRTNLDKHRQRFNMRLHYHRNGYPYDSYSEKERKIWVEFTVDGDYFKNREGITFNSDGFVGFAGWASDSNCEPFVKAFTDWVNWMKTEGVINVPLNIPNAIPSPSDNSFQTTLDIYKNIN